MTDSDIRDQGIVLFRQVGQDEPKERARAFQAMETPAKEYRRG